MKKLIIVKTGETFPNIAKRYGDFDTWTRKGLNIDQAEVRVLDAANDFTLPQAEECAGVVLTGSRAMVTDSFSWIMKLREWIPTLLKKEVPLLGICFGHQLLALAAGGVVGFHPRGKEIGTVDIHLLPTSSDDPLFRSLPPRISAHVTHSQTVLSQPADAVRLAENSFESTHAFRLGKCAWGLQFHPEFDANIMTACVREDADELKKTGRDVSAILRNIKETPSAAKVLAEFGRNCFREIKR